MTAIIKDNSQAIMTKDVVDALTKMVLDLPQADCPVAHYFGPGTYIRQVFFPEGIFAIGHKQRFRQMNIFIAGRVAMVQPDGTLKELRAPMIFNGGPGQKMGIILEPVTWLNVFPNPDEERDIDILENRFLDKSGPWSQKEDAEKEQRYNSHNRDREDFYNFLKEYNFSDEDILSEKEHAAEYIEMPEGFTSVITVRDSYIDGKGIFVSWPFNAGEIIGPVRIENKLTNLGRYLNHSINPNSKYIRVENGDLILVAVKDISGCKGGDRGEELTINYRESIKLRDKPCVEQ